MSYVANVPEEVRKIVKGLKDGDWVSVEEKGIYPWKGHLIFTQFGPYIKDASKRHRIHKGMSIKLCKND